jgi:hypothetical protein
MATLVRQIITPLLKNPLAWRVLDGTFLRIARKMDQWRRAAIGDGAPLDSSIRGRFLNRVVRHGLFYGMKYPSLEAAGSTLYPKLLGSYERELHGIMERIVRTDYATVVDIGCAEGYYAAGLALRLPEARVFASIRIPVPGNSAGNWRKPMASPPASKFTDPVRRRLS